MPRFKLMDGNLCYDFYETEEEAKKELAELIDEAQANLDDVQGWEVEEEET